MVIEIGSTLGLAILSGVLYRMGGKGKPYNTKVRDLGCPLTMVVAMSILAGFKFILLICALLMFASMTTYFKKKGEDARWYNWLFVGLAYSLSMFPYAIATGQYLGFSLRLVVNSMFITLWSEFIDNDVLEEFGRGFINITTLPLLLIR